MPTDAEIRKCLYDYGLSLGEFMETDDVDPNDPASLQEFVDDMWDETSYTYPESFEYALDEKLGIGSQWSELRERADLDLVGEFNRGLKDGVKSKSSPPAKKTAPKKKKAKKKKAKKRAASKKPTPKKKRAAKKKKKKVVRAKKRAKKKRPAKKRRSG